MKDKIITFILITLIIGVLGVIGTLGYEVYKELSKQGRIEISFESETGFPTLEFIPKEESAGNFTIDEDMFSGIEGTTQAASSDTLNSKPSRYLYNQLSSTAKTIYNGLYNNKDNLKTGT